MDLPPPSPIAPWRVSHSLPTTQPTVVGAVRLDRPYDTTTTLLSLPVLVRGIPNSDAGPQFACTTCYYSVFCIASALGEKERDGLDSRTGNSVGGSDSFNWVLLVRLWPAFAFFGLQKNLKIPRHHIYRMRAPGRDVGWHPWLVVFPVILMPWSGRRDGT